MGYPHRHPGERYQLPEAEEQNAWNDTAELYILQQRLAEKIPDSRLPVHPELDKIKIENASGEDLPKGSVLQIEGSPLETDQQGQPVQNAKGPTRVHPWLRGVKVKEPSCGCFCIILRPTKSGKIDDADTNGIVFALVDITDSKKRCKAAKDKTHLVGDDCGDIKILWAPKDETAGVHECIIDMGQPDTPHKCYKARAIECSGPGNSYLAEIYTYNPDTTYHDIKVTDPDILGVQGGIVTVWDHYADAWMILDATSGSTTDVCRIPYVDQTGECHVAWVQTSENRLTRWARADQLIPAYGSGSVTVWGYPYGGGCQGSPLNCSVIACNGEPGEVGVRDVQAGEILKVSNEQVGVYKLMYRTGGTATLVCFELTSDRTRESGPTGLFGRASAIVRDVNGPVPNVVGDPIEVRFCEKLWLSAVTGCYGLAVPTHAKNQQGQQVYVVIECRTLAATIIFKTTADRSPTVPNEDVPISSSLLSYHGGDNATYDPAVWLGQNPIVRFPELHFPYALMGSQGTAHLDVDETNETSSAGMRYKVAITDQMSPFQEVTHDGFCPLESPAISAWDSMMFHPFSQRPTLIEQAQDYMGLSSAGGEGVIIWHELAKEWVMLQPWHDLFDVVIEGGDCLQKQQFSMMPCGQPEELDLIEDMLYDVSLDVEIEEGSGQGASGCENSTAKLRLDSRTRPTLVCGPISPVTSTYLPMDVIEDTVDVFWDGVCIGQTKQCMAVFKVGEEYDGDDVLCFEEFVCPSGSGGS